MPLATALSSNLRWQDEIHGDLFKQVNQTIDVLHARYLRAWITREALQQVETCPVPEAALREAVRNSVMRRDCAIATPIRISVSRCGWMAWNLAKARGERRGPPPASGEPRRSPASRPSMEMSSSSASR